MKPQTILTKQELHWHIINEHIKNIAAFRLGSEDEDFCKLLKELQKYVNNKLTLPCDGEISDFFVLVLQQSKK